jgi:hypothetical protein
MFARDGAMDEGVVPGVAVVGKHRPGATLGATLSRHMRSSAGRARYRHVSARVRGRHSAEVKLRNDSILSLRFRRRGPKHLSRTLVLSARAWQSYRSDMQVIGGSVERETARWAWVLALGAAALRRYSKIP